MTTKAQGWRKRQIADKQDERVAKTAKQRHDWVGLTDAEIEEFDYYARDLVMDIEKLLRERNS